MSCLLAWLPWTSFHQRAPMKLLWLERRELPAVGQPRHAGRRRAEAAGAGRMGPRVAGRPRLAGPAADFLGFCSVRPGDAGLAGPPRVAAGRAAARCHGRQFPATRGDGMSNGVQLIAVCPPAAAPLKLFCSTAAQKGSLASLPAATMTGRRSMTSHCVPGQEHIRHTAAFSTQMNSGSPDVSHPPLRIVALRIAGVDQLQNFLRRLPTAAVPVD